MQQKQKVLIALIVASVVILGGFFLFKDKISDLTSKNGVTNVEVVSKVDIDYPQGWTEQTLTDGDKIAGIILNLEKKDPEASFILRTIVGQLEENINMSDLSDKIVDTFNQEIENFDLVSKKVYRLDSFDAIEVRYTQESEAEDNKVFENLIIIIPTKNQTFYLTFRANESDFDQIQEDIEKISKDFGGQIKSIK